MGITSSKKTIDNNDNTLKLFHKETEYMNEILDKIMKNKQTDEFFDENLNFAQGSSLCDHFTLVLENSLKKHLKIEVKDLNAQLLLIPNDAIEGIKKEQLCSVATDHYKQIFQLIFLLKSVYDIENYGNNSLLGICLQLIQFNNDVFTIAYCEGEHREERRIRNNSNSNSNSNSKNKKLDEGNSIDIKQLRGLDLLYTNFLDDYEKKNIIQNFRIFFQYNTNNANNANNANSVNVNLNKKDKRNKKDLIGALFCGDHLLTPKEYEEVFSTSHLNTETKTCNKVSAFNQKEKIKDIDNTRVQIKGKNPIFYPYCTLEKKLEIQFDKISPNDASQLKQMYMVMRQEYKKNMDNIYKLLKGIVVYDGNKKIYTIKNLTSNELLELRIKAKKQVIQFYFTSILNYQNVLDYALSLPHETIYL